MGIFDWIFGKKETSSDPEKKIISKCWDEYGNEVKCEQ